VITFRIAHLIDRGVLPENVLAVTFTNKAAREMRERVAKLIPKRAKSRKSGLQNAERLVSNGESSQLSVRNPQPTICTFHSLCVRILRQHIEKLGYKKNFVIYDESEQI